MRHFLIAYYGSFSNGTTLIGSCTTTMPDGEKMTQKRLDGLMKEAMEEHGANQVIPLAVSELEEE